MVGNDYFQPNVLRKKGEFEDDGDTSQKRLCLVIPHIFKKDTFYIST